MIGVSWRTPVEVVSEVKLTKDREVKGLWLREVNRPEINLNGNLLTVGSGGINFEYNEEQPYLWSGRITSSDSALTIKSTTHGRSEINEYGEVIRVNAHLNAAIENNGSHRVGLVLTGEKSKSEYGLVSLSGTQSNTFTGDVLIEGARNVLFLAKRDGATAIQSNVHVRRAGRLAISSSNQISDSSTVILAGNGSQFTFTTSSVDLTEKIHSLKVESGNGILNFAHWGKAPDNSNKTLFLDDLIINERASLRIVGWGAGRDHLLVRKDSKHLNDALKKLTIDGWGKNQIYLKSYDKDYWSIEAAPEPSTYGAIFGTLGFGVWAWRRRISKECRTG